ncbi:hypothetical protein KSX_09640 [Ktedonospora formicarum]|uniref:Uncharacterized protein n=1 Tax=Ktedonospora formicarum TaxID=2778364 RepID=A0A8J3HT60_9CHLR|nr:hypothetical protein KSX_09640 [Ktedonospora formicarum]
MWVFKTMPFVAIVLVVIGITIAKMSQRGILAIGKSEQGFTARLGAMRFKREVEVSQGGAKKFFSFKFRAVRIIRTVRRTEGGWFKVGTLKVGVFMVVRHKKRTMQEHYWRATCRIARPWQKYTPELAFSFKRPTSYARRGAKEQRLRNRGIDLSKRMLKKQRLLLSIAATVLAVVLCISTAVFVLGLGVKPRYDSHTWWLGLKVFAAIGPSLMAGPFVLASTYVLGRRIREVAIWYDTPARQAVRLTITGLLISYLVTLTTSTAGKGVALAQQCILVLGFLVVRSFIGRGDEQAALAKRMEKMMKRRGADHHPLFPQAQDWFWASTGLALLALALVGAIWSWMVTVRLSTPIGEVDDLLIFRTCVGTIMAGLMTIAARLGGQVSRLGLGYLGWWAVTDRRPWAALLHRRGWQKMGPLWGLLTSLGQILALNVFGTFMSVYLAQMAAKVYAHHWEAYTNSTAFPVAQSGALLAALEFVGGIVGLISMVLMSSGKDAPAQEQSTQSKAD